MTTVLRPVPSGSTVVPEEFVDSAPVTRPPDLSEFIGWYVDSENPLGAGIYDDALTTVDILALPIEPVGGGLEVLPEEQRRVGGHLGKLVLPAYQVSVTGRSQGSVVSFSIELEGGTSLGYANLAESAFESGAFGAAEAIPEMLQDALDALADVRSVAREEDCDEPSDLAIGNAEVLIRKMFELSERTFDIYPMGGGEIAIDVGNRRRRIGVFCYPDGKVQYVAILDNVREDIRKDDVQGIPIALLRRALNQLDS